MKEEAKQAINAALTLLKTTMKTYDVHFAMLIDKKDGNKSRIAFLDRSSLELGIKDGISVSIDEMNRDSNVVEGNHE